MDIIIKYLCQAWATLLLEERVGYALKLLIVVHVDLERADHFVIQEKFGSTWFVVSGH